jgi:predicted amidophosphoribosyltransferase
MITQQEMERLATIGQLCWDCDDAPTFEDNSLCEDCLYRLQHFTVGSA